MATPAPAFPLGSGALAVLNVDALLRRLPIRDALLELRKGEFTDEAVQAAARRTWPAMQTVVQAFWENFAQNREEWRAAVAAELHQDREKLERFVDDDDTRDTIEWLFSFLEACFNLFLPLVTPESLHQIPQENWNKLSEDPDFLPFLTGNIALTAALDAADAGQDWERARELLDIAFLDLNRARSTFRRLGLWLSPFPNETIEARGTRALRYAERVRRALTSDDLAAIEGARVQALR